MIGKPICWTILRYMTPNKIMTIWLMIYSMLPGNTKTNKEAEPPSNAITEPILGTNWAISREMKKNMMVTPTRRWTSLSQYLGPQKLSTASIITNLNKRKQIHEKKGWGGRNKIVYAILKWKEGTVRMIKPWYFIIRNLNLNACFRVVNRNNCEMKNSLPKAPED